MNQKNSLQYITDYVAQATGEPKKVAEQFAKAFFDTIVEALYLGETAIKIKGLGTFKLIEVDSRESVNVANGERIVIPAYKKVAFVPDDEIVDRLNKQGARQSAAAEDEDEPKATEAPAAVNETEAEYETGDETVNESETEAERTESQDDDDDQLNELVVPEEMEHVEKPLGNLGGIDLLISTPESIEEIRAQYEEAKQRAEAAIAEAKQANTERLRLEKMLERLEANTTPEASTVPEADLEPEESSTPETSLTQSEEEEKLEEEPPASVETVDDSDTLAAPEDADDEPTEFVQTYINKVTEAQGKEEQRIIRNKRWAMAVATLLLAVCGIVYFLREVRHSVETVVEADVIETQAQPRRIATRHYVAPAAAAVLPIIQMQDTMTSVAPAVQEAAKPERTVPEFCILKKGESLTKISLQYYGTKDSVAAIVRANRFNDPNNVPVGAKVYLP